MRSFCRAISGWSDLVPSAGDSEISVWGWLRRYRAISHLTPTEGGGGEGTEEDRWDWDRHRRTTVEGESALAEELATSSN